MLESPNPNTSYFTRSDSFEQMVGGLASVEIERGHASSVTAFQMCKTKRDRTPSKETTVFKRRKGA